MVNESQEGDPEYERRMRELEEEASRMIWEKFQEIPWEASDKRKKKKKQEDSKSQHPKE